MDQLDALDALERNAKRGSALQTLMEIENVLDKLNIYAYENWIEGEVVDGPHIERYWVTVTIMYRYKDMPDPEGAQRLIDHGARVYYSKDKFISAAKLIGPDDVEVTDGQGNRAAKKVEQQVWLITLEIPRSFLDSITTSELRAQEYDVDVDTDAVEQAWDEGLSDDDMVQADDEEELN